MNKFDLCALFCRCSELTEMGHDTFFHYCPHVDRVRIHHYFGKWAEGGGVEYEVFEVGPDSDAGMYGVMTIRDACVKLDEAIETVKGGLLWQQ